MKRVFSALLVVALCTGAQAQTVAPTPSPLASGTAAPTSQASAVPSGTPAGTPLATPAASGTPIATSTPRPAAKTVSAATYRALLQGALDALGKTRARATTNAVPILKPLDAPFKVQREDGQTQTVRGDEWDQILTGATQASANKLSRQQKVVLQGTLRERIRALDDWTTKRNGSYYTALDGQKIVNDAVANGQIRVGPPPLQKALGNIKTALSNAVDAFFRWLSSIMPKPKTSASSASMPNLSWLVFIFWGVLLGVLGVILFLAARALSGGTFTLWGLGRRRKKSPDELRDEDAELFQLAPEELRDRADMFAAQGNFREALRHRFISLLVLLDARGLWRYDIRRTNWEHIAALRRDEGKRPLVGPLSNLTRAFDRVRYGGAPCDENGWNEFQSGVREIEAIVGGKAVAR